MGGLSDSIDLLPQGDGAFSDEISTDLICGPKLFVHGHGLAASRKNLRLRRKKSGTNLIVPLGFQN